MNTLRYSTSAVAIALVIFLPACKPFEWIKRTLGADSTAPEVKRSNRDVSSSPSSDQGATLVTVNGKSVLTVEEFDKEFNEFVDKNNLRPIIGLMPDAKEKYIQGRKSQFIIDEEIKEKGIDKTTEYKEKLEQITKAGRQMLNVEFFVDMHPVDVSETDVKKFYEQYKDKLPDIILSRGGVNVAGIKFDNEKDAQTFFDKAKNKPEQFVQLAKEAQLEGKLKEFNLVNEQSMMVETPIREKVLSYKKFPQLEVIKVSDNACWVIFAKEKKASECRPFEEVKATIEQYVMREKRKEVLEKEIERLGEVYKVSVNTDLIKSEAPQMTFADEEIEESSASLSPQAL